MCTPMTISSPSLTLFLFSSLPHCASHLPSASPSLALSPSLLSPVSLFTSHSFCDPICPIRVATLPVVTQLMNQSLFLSLSPFFLPFLSPFLPPSPYPFTLSIISCLWIFRKGRALCAPHPPIQDVSRPSLMPALGR